MGMATSIKLNFRVREKNYEIRSHQYAYIYPAHS